MELKGGSRWRSAVCATEVIVVRPPSGDVDLRCGGQPMTDDAAGQPSGEPAPAFADGTLVGKRFADPDSGLELLCVTGGAGTLSLGDTPIPLKDAKPLPSSD